MMWIFGFSWWVPLMKSRVQTLEHVEFTRTYWDLTSHFMLSEASNIGIETMNKQYSRNWGIPQSIHKTTIRMVSTSLHLERPDDHGAPCYNFGSWADDCRGYIYMYIYKVNLINIYMWYTLTYTHTHARHYPIQHKYIHTHIENSHHQLRIPKTSAKSSCELPTQQKVSSHQELQTACTWVARSREPKASGLILFYYDLGR